MQDDFLATRMDGSRRISDLVIDYFRQFGRFGFDRIATLVSDLRNSGFLVDPPRNVYQELKSRLQPQATPPRTGRWEGTPLRLRLPLRGIDPLIGRLHDRLHWIFTRPVQLLTAVIGVTGLVAFIFEVRAGHDPFAPIANSGVAGLVALVLAFYFVIFIHESAHALTAKHFGRRVDEGGFMLYYFIPSFYVNVTDAWMETWYRRVAIFWAGPYSGFVLAGFCSLLVAFVPGPALVMTVLFKIAVAAYINNVLNLMPLLLLDGYWILEELLETPKLRQKAMDFVRGPFWHRLLDRKRLTGKETFYAVFGSLCAVYSFLSIYLAFLWWGRRLRPIVRTAGQAGTGCRHRGSSDSAQHPPCPSALGLPAGHQAGTGGRSKSPPDYSGARPAHTPAGLGFPSDAAACQPGPARPCGARPRGRARQYDRPPG